MSERLRQVFGECYKIFMENLVKYNKFISGSFLLQVIYGVTWEGSDIDIYYMSNGRYFSYFVDEFMYNSKDIYGMDDIGDYESYDFLPVRIRRFEVKDTKHIVDYVEIMEDDKPYTDIINDCVVHIPNFKYENVFQFIDDMYDIEICKIIYDGKRLYVKNLSSLFERSSKVVLHMNKYIRRSPWAHNAEENTPVRLVEKVLKRIDKYKARGFKLTLQFDPTTELIKAKSEEEKIKTCKEHLSCKGYAKYNLSKESPTIFH